MFGIFKRQDTTEPVKSFVYDHLCKYNMLKKYDGMNIKELKSELKSVYKSKIDRWLYRRSNWTTVALAIMVKIDETQNNN